MHFLEPRGFSVLDLENLRLHYALTLRHWLLRFDAAADKVAELFDEAFVRAWRLYLTGSMAGFTSGSLQLFQIVFSRPGLNDIPWTTAHGCTRGWCSPHGALRRADRGRRTGRLDLCMAAPPRRAQRRRARQGSLSATKGLRRLDHPQRPPIAGTRSDRVWKRPRAASDDCLPRRPRRRAGDDGLLRPAGELRRLPPRVR